MLHAFRLLLPALIPSWRFFDTIAPSPRIEFALLQTAQDEPIEWQEFRPRPARLSASRLLMRLFWNPKWNESLFLVGCAERLMSEPTEYEAREILRRIRADLQRRGRDTETLPYLRFRLAFLSRQGREIRKDIVFLSSINHLSEAVS